MCDFRVIEQDYANEAAKCICKPAVFNAYETLKSHGHKKAMDAAMKIYLYHHPEDTIEDAQITVERWLVAQSGQIH
jgi:hypothetical protein